MRSLLCLLLGTIFLAACGTPPETAADAGADPQDAGLDAGGPPQDAGHPPPDAGTQDAGVAPFGVEAWCSHLAFTRCARDERCLQLDGANFDACLARESTACNQVAVEKGVAAGRLQYSDTAAADCINGFAHVACWEEPAACSTVFSGQVPAEGACVLDAECLPGTYCHETSQTCPHRCIAYRPVGAVCNWWDQQCDPFESSCTSSGGTNVCVARKDAGASCVYWSDCKQDLACIDSVCVPRYAKHGEVCATAQGYPSCDTGLFCRHPLGAKEGPGVCERKASLGGVCSGYGSCLPGLRCSSNYATGTCVPLGSEGDVCSTWSDCRRELYCNLEASRCTALPAADADCGSGASFYACAPGFFCDYQTDICESLRTLGESCSYDGSCQSGDCEYGTLPDGGNGYRCVESCAARLDGGR